MSRLVYLLIYISLFYHCFISHFRFSYVSIPFSTPMSKGYISHFTSIDCILYINFLVLFSKCTEKY